MYRAMQALRGKEVLKKDVYDMCLVLNVQIPHKFKLPDFEKYKETSCPKDHLTLYVRKMSTYANDHQVLIHYYQDSLTGAALKWYMNLNCAESELSITCVNPSCINTNSMWTWLLTKVIFRL